MRRVLKVALATAALGFAMASPAGASTVVGNVAVSGSSNTCDTVPTADTSPASIQCAGYFDGNVLNDGNSMISGYTNNLDVIAAAVAALGGTFSGTLTSYTGGTVVGDINAFLGAPNGFTGVQIIGIHYGQGSAGTDSTVGNVTAFYKIDFGSTPTKLAVNLNGLSNAYLFTSVPGVPEPATWAMMLLGFGGIGMAMRRRRKESDALMQVA